jgi:hypothetical protein
VRAWLVGDFSAVEPRAGLEAIKVCIEEAIERGEPIDPMVHGLAHRDPWACAELLVGPRAIAVPEGVRAALGVAEILEDVMQPSGLYRRFTELAPARGPEILGVAAHRHPEALWQLRLAQGLEPVAGTAALAATRGGPRFAPTCAALASAGLERALVGAAAQGELEPMLALYRAGKRAGAVRAGAALLDAHPAAPLVPWLAAVHGPALGPLLREIAAALRTDAARSALRLVAADFVTEVGSGPSLG